MDFIEIHMISNRPWLDEFIGMWNNVIIEKDIDATIKVLTMSYDEKKFVLGNGIKIEYIRQRTFPKTTCMCQAHARNELLCYAGIGEHDKENNRNKYILFYDDWQRPDPNILIEHLKHSNVGYVAICGRRFECDKNGENCKDDARNTGGGTYPRQCGSGEFWTCNSSCRLESILAVNGFDNRFNGGTAGEDTHLGMRMSRIIGAGGGIGMLYNPMAISYHYSHDHLGSGSNRNGIPVTCGYSHITSDYKYIPEYKHFGKWERMDSDEFEFWWEGPIKYYKCKRCGIVGILDSIQVRDYNISHNVIRCENGLEQVRSKLREVS